MISREGIVIKTIKYQETSKIVYVLCEDGLVSLLMRNANNFKSKKINARHPFQDAEARYHLISCKARSQSVQKIQHLCNGRKTVHS